MKDEILAVFYFWRRYIGSIRFFYNPYFSTCFFSQNSVFLSQQINRNSIPVCFFSEANGANVH